MARKRPMQDDLELFRAFAERRAEMGCPLIPAKENGEAINQVIKEVNRIAQSE